MKIRLLTIAMAVTLLLAAALPAAAAAKPEQKDSTVLVNEATGTARYSKNSAEIDASNIKDGYLMCRYTGPEAKLKVRLTCPDDTKLDFSLESDGQWAAFPLSYGDGEYKIGVYRQKSGTKYSLLLSQTLTVTLTDPFGPFLRPSRIVDFDADSAVTAKAAELTAKCKDGLEKVAAVYDFTIKELSYDYNKAEKIKTGVISGYVPDVDAVLAAKTGICSDYSSLMAAMLRSQGVPTKLVYGYAGTIYHAWLSVYTEEYGWVEGVIYFDGKTWMRMDPTFASTSASSAKILSYIGDGSNYTVKYVY